MTQRLVVVCAILALTGMLGFERAAVGQSQQLAARLDGAVEKVEAACSDDLKKYCSTVTPGEGRLILCMQAHEDKISEKCDFALFDASRKINRALDRIDRAADICWGDIEKYCSNIPEGGGRILQCLSGQKTSLTPACQTEIGKLSSLN
jgi:Cysteine rich repeat